MLFPSDALNICIKYQLIITHIAIFFKNPVGIYPIYLNIYAVHLRKMCIMRKKEGIYLQNTGICLPANSEHHFIVTDDSFIFTAYKSVKILLDIGILIIVKTECIVNYPFIGML